MDARLDRLRRDALAIYEAAIAAVEPGRAVHRALATTPPPDRVVLLAVGKAARPMAKAAVEHLSALEIPLTGGAVVAPEDGPPIDSRLHHTIGDHPLPGPRSAAAADLIGLVARTVTARDEVWLLLSGGTSSLLGAPAEGIAAKDYADLMGLLFRAGLPIDALNQLRRRFSRWGAGRLLGVLAAPRVRVFALSDVLGDDPADIGSGPCEPDPLTAADVIDRLTAFDLIGSTPPAILDWLDRTRRGETPETPKPTDPAFARRTVRIVASNTVAVRHAAERARTLGYRVETVADPIVGPAREAGESFLAGWPTEPPADPVARIGGGETTVRLAPEAGTGGRCQELALAAARVLFRSPRPGSVLLAAGTDGRDGPTDAAGALVDGGTWEAIRRAGRDPDAALAMHDAYPALAAAGALVTTGLSGTNVMDLIVGLRA